MRLAEIRIRGYGKLVDTSCKVTGKLTAFIGPNEVGKSTLLRALASLRYNREEVPAAARPRGLEVNDADTAVEVWFRLDDNDLAALTDIASPDRPTWYVLGKRYGGELFSLIDPLLRRDDASRRKAQQWVTHFSKTKAARALERNAEANGTGDLLDLATRLLLADQDLSEDQRDVMEILLDHLRTEEVGRLGHRASEALRSWLISLEDDHPNEVAQVRLAKRRPWFVMFSEEDRSLSSDYDLRSAADDPPAALQNLADVARLNLSELAAAVARQDVGTAVTATEAANEILASVFAEAWKQSPVTVRLHQDGHNLRILVSNEAGGYSVIAERSDGLKAFVALTAFASQEGLRGRPMILLIDEAEQHLHYDAQADLVRMLDRQGLAAQVLYTSHSAGCLPADLGTGVRPIAPAGVGAGYSKLSNSFWTEGPGFTPLLMAMGAGVTALVPSRYAVLTEGPSDMLLLPTLIREATGKDRLDYQVAPGIAESSSASLIALDLEAPRVAYCVDGDAGGAEHVRRLCSAGVPPGSVVQLGGASSGLALEDLLREEVYLAAANEAVLRTVGDGVSIGTHDLRGRSRTNALAGWCARRGIRPISKVLVAGMLLEQGPERYLTREGERVVRVAHKALCKALDVPE